jgi:hypothetical protein
MSRAKKLDYEIDKNGCFLCTSHKARIVKNGYVTQRIYRGGKFYLLHRFIYEQMFGPIAPGLVVRHKCDNSLCINPEHLELGTQKQNMADMIKRGRGRWQK